jgi:hypothetical protein
MDRLECGALQAERQMHLVSRDLLHQVEREPFVHSQDVERVGSAFVLERQDLLIETHGFGLIADPQNHVVQRNHGIPASSSPRFGVTRAIRISS